MNVCKFCQKETKKRVFCCRECKSEWQRTQKPVSKEWLYQKYVIEQISCNEIAKMINRNSKRVYEWLIDYEIPTRPRGHNHADNPKFAFWKSGEPNPFEGRKHSQESITKMSESSSGPAPWLRGEVHRLYGKKGEDSPWWKGGVTPERQAFCTLSEWKEAVKAVWQRDDATCRKCGLKKDSCREIQFDIHHIVSFADSVELRSNLNNLVLLCHPCHLWVHSNKNTNKEFVNHDT